MTPALACVIRGPPCFTYDSIHVFVTVDGFNAYFVCCGAKSLDPNHRAICHSCDQLSHDSNLALRLSSVPSS